MPAAAQTAPARLDFDAVRGIAEDPRCGRAEPGSEFARRVAAIAMYESGGDPLIIGVNADRARSLPAAVVRSATAQEAAAKARALMAQGRSIDLGLGQINSANLARHGLAVEAAFVACRNVEALADHYAGDVRAVWHLAHRRYNTGSTERGAAYAAGVEQVLARAARARPGAPGGSATPLVLVPEPPDPAPCAPAWDAWALAECTARQQPPARPPQGGPSLVTATAGSPDADPSLPSAR